MRAKTIAALIAAGALIAPACAQAHVSLHPNTIPAGAFVTLDVRVPGEEEHAYAYKVDMLLPPGFTEVDTQNVPGWSVKETKTKLKKPLRRPADRSTKRSPRSSGRAIAARSAGSKTGPSSSSRSRSRCPKASPARRSPSRRSSTTATGKSRTGSGRPTPSYPAPTVDITPKGGRDRGRRRRRGRPRRPGPGALLGRTRERLLEQLGRRERGPGHRRPGARRPRPADRRHGAGGGSAAAGNGVGSGWRCRLAGRGIRAPAIGAASRAPRCPAGSRPRPQRRPPRRLGGLPGAGVRPRHRRADRPADPRVDVRLGGGVRPDRLLRRARDPLAQTAPAAAQDAPHVHVPGLAGTAGGGARRSALRDRRLQRRRRRPGADRQPGADLRLRPLLGRLPGGQRPLRRRLPAGQPVAGHRPGDRLGAAPGQRRRAPGRRFATRTGSASGPRSRP